MLTNVESLQASVVPSATLEGEDVAIAEIGSVGREVSANHRVGAWILGRDRREVERDAIVRSEQVESALHAAQQPQGQPTRQPGRRLTLGTHVTAMIGFSSS